MVGVKKKKSLDPVCRCGLLKLGGSHGGVSRKGPEASVDIQESF